MPVKHFVRVPALAYLLTFSTYGTHLPGSEKGWVNTRKNSVGGPAQASHPNLEAHCRFRLNEPPCTLDQEARLVTLDAVLAVCGHRQWTAFVVHVRTMHVHAVIGGEGKPERMLSDFKAYATRALRSANPNGPRRAYWTRHGSTRYLWNRVSLQTAIDYVHDGQGIPMARYPT